MDDSQLIHLRDLFLFILKSIFTGIVTAIVVTYFLKPYLDTTLAKDKVNKIVKSESFWFAIAIAILSIFTVFKPSTAPYIWGHGLRNYQYTRYMEEVHSFIPAMINELNSFEAMKDGRKIDIDWDFLALQEEMYFIIFEKDGKYSFKQNNLEESRKFSGIHVVYYINKQIYSETRYQNGNRLEDGYRAYYNNGRRRVEIATTPESKDFIKTIRYYYNNGALWIEYKFRDQHTVYGKIYTKDGNLINSGDHMFYSILVSGYFENKDILPIVNPQLINMM